MAPHFLGVGAQKAGTTWLYARLAGHPQVFMPAIKEVHFWDLYSDRGLDWYRSLFEPGLNAGQRCGEITPAYAILPPERIAEIRRTFADARLLYVVRNPLERAWSAALMCLERAELEYHEASPQWFIDHFRSAGSRRRGDYETCMRNWLALYPADQWLLLDYGDLARDPRALLRQVAAHIGVDPDWYARRPDAELQTRVHFGPGGSTRAASHRLPDPLREVLADLYAEPIRSFQAYCGRDFGWLT